MGFFIRQFHYMPEIKPSASLVSFIYCGVEVDRRTLLCPGSLMPCGHLYLPSCSSQVWSSFESSLHQGLPLIMYVGAAWHNRAVILVVASDAPLVQIIISIPSILLFVTDLY